MANEKNKINELVCDDEDSTAELEAITFRQDHPTHDALLESDDDTFEVEDRRSEDARTIGKLRYDIEQLRAKWMGLEAELEAREEITDALNAEAGKIRDTLARKEKLLKSRDRTIKSLKVEIRERDEKYRDQVAELESKLDDARALLRDVPAGSGDTRSKHRDVSDAERLARTEAYADLLRRKLQNALASHDHLDKTRQRLAGDLSAAEERGRAMQKQIIELNENCANLGERLASIEDTHAEEIRMLRFELGEAQETVAQTEELNTQLASDLVDTRGFKEELERMLCDSDEQSRTRIEELELALSKATLEVAELEEKLEARSDAINVLLAELARRSEQMESIGEIGDVISDIDDRISEQFEEPDEAPRPSRPQDRLTRVLVGKIGDKLLRFPLFKSRLTIGRTADNDIQLNAPFISRRHAVVTTDGETTRVIDWGSKNGVYVNSTRITEHFLGNGDILTIGNAHFRYEERPKRDA